MTARVIDRPNPMAAALMSRMQIAEAMREVARAQMIDRARVVDSDAQEPASRDGQNLRRLVAEAAQRVETELMQLQGLVLLPTPGGWRAMANSACRSLSGIGAVAPCAQRGW